MNDELIVPKKRKAVTLWVHPEGRVAGSIFLYGAQTEHNSAEDPFDVMNTEADFIAVALEADGGVRFYNKRSIVRMEYAGPEHAKPNDLTTLHCRMQMMDGSLLNGIVHEVLQPWRARLYDYVNHAGHRFIRLEPEPGKFCLVNKAYIVHIAPVNDSTSD